MRFIDRVFKRVLISLFTGGAIAELINVLTGKDNMSSPIVAVSFVLMMILTTIIVYFKRRKETKLRMYNDEILDN